MTSVTVGGAEMSLFKVMSLLMVRDVHVFRINLNAQNK